MESGGAAGDAASGAGGAADVAAAAEAATSALWRSMSAGGGASGSDKKGAGVLEEVEAAGADEDDLLRAAGWDRQMAAGSQDAGGEDIAAMWRASMDGAGGPSKAKAAAGGSSGKPSASAGPKAPRAARAGAGAAAGASTGSVATADADPWEAAVSHALGEGAAGSGEESGALKPRGLQRGSGTRDADEWAVTRRMTAEELDAAEARRTPALEFPFKLDTFQREAVTHVDEGESVFVAAHTSAGKTVVAEYAIAQCARNCTRCIYTSPIKALSNQKYRDFKDRFGDVGLVTGDISVDPEASCLVMTTEILRSMLYRGSDVVRDIEWVIFDEVHYVNDSERGVVWEETIILLPDHVGMVFLSATTPNTVEFCEWIGRTKRRPVHVVTTAHRPVPLSHALLAKNKAFPLLTPEGRFLPDGRSEAAVKLAGKVTRSSGMRGPGRGGGAGRAGGHGVRGGRSWGRGDKEQWMGVVQHLTKHELTPAVVFLFSKQQCADAASMLSGAGLLNHAEQAQVRGFVDAAASRLHGSDKRLGQLLWLRQLLSAGVAVHHGGLLPILKEVVELLFARGLVRVLFATETFAMGVNMPARTVVFGSIRKHDGRSMRYLLPGEYTQMAGRAGRRGLDSVGTVLLACFGDEPPPLEDLRVMLKGTPATLRSQFRLTYPMLLSLLRVEDMSVADMMRQSYSEFAAQRAIAGGDLPALIGRGGASLRALDASLREDRHSASLATALYDAVTAAAAADRAVVDILLSDAALRNQALAAGRVATVTARLPGDLADRARVLPAMVLSLDASAGADWGVNVLVVAPRGWAGEASDAKTEASSAAPGAPVAAAAPAAPGPAAAEQRSSRRGGKGGFGGGGGGLLGSSGKGGFGGGGGGLLGSSGKGGFGGGGGGLLGSSGKGGFGGGGGGLLGSSAVPAAAQAPTSTTAASAEADLGKVSVGWVGEVARRWVAVLRVPGSAVLRLFGKVVRRVKPEDFASFGEDAAAGAGAADGPTAGTSMGGGGLGDSLMGGGGGGAGGLLGMGGASSKRGRKRGGRSGRGGGGDADGSPRDALAAVVSQFLDVLTPAEDAAGVAAGAAAESPPDEVALVSYEPGVAAALPDLDPTAEFSDASNVDLFQAAGAAAMRWQTVQELRSAASSAGFSKAWSLVARRARLLRQLRLLRRRVSDESLRLFPELRSMSRVLQRLAYVRKVDGPVLASDGADLTPAAAAGAAALEDGEPAEPDADLSSLVVELKGRVACEVQSAHALVLTELIFEGVMAPLEPEEVAALLSAFICQEKAGESLSSAALSPNLETACARAQEIALAVGTAQQSCGLPGDAESFVEQTLNFGLLQVVLEWARGTPFAAITPLAPRVQEGSIVRTITRLDNTCREVRAAARIIGDPQLFKKAEAASAAIKRDIVFAASLYIA